MTEFLIGVAALSLFGSVIAVVELVNSWKAKNGNRK